MDLQVVRSQKINFSKGFTLMESLVFLAIFMLVSVIFLQVYIVGTRTIIDVRNRLGAVALANQRMEIIRSLEYDEIGTKQWNGTAWVYGVPAGNLLQQEQVTTNNRPFTVNTFVQYVDDSYDRLASSSPADTIPTDYKRVRVEVVWGQKTSEKVTLFANFSPPGRELPATGGVLSVNILHVNGTPVSGATVTITQSALGISVNGVSDAQGNVTLPGMPAASQSYVISVSKSGYLPVTTYAPYPTTSFTPVDRHATVVANTYNQFSIVMDQTVAIPIHIVDPFDQSIASVSFSIQGGRLLGTHPTTGVKTFSLASTNQTTDASGMVTLSNQSYGVYTITLNSSSSGQYELYGFLPDTNLATGSFDRAPGASSEVKVVLIDKTFPAILVTVLNDNTSTPLAGASVQVTSSTGYSATGTTDRLGRVYVPQSATPLTAGTYTVQVTHNDYNTETQNISVSSVLEKKTIRLDPHH